MTAPQVADGDRFAAWRPLPAIVALIVFTVLLILAVMAPIGAGGTPPRDRTSPEAALAADADLNLYASISRRLRAGENYYDVVIPAQRHHGYPVRPAVAVRLPTLAYLQAWLEAAGQWIVALALLAALIAAWWRRLLAEPGAHGRIPLGLALVLAGSCLALNSDYFPLHELWAGLLMALAFALYRPGDRWAGALVAAGLALAVRELALPFVLLAAAWAIFAGRKREAAAWIALVACFAVVMALHVAAVEGRTLPTDPLSPSWLALRGLAGAIGNVVLSSPLYLVPHWLASPLVVLALLGWAGWKSPAGLFGTQLYLGYLLAFAIAGRPNNFYWGLLISPALLVGLAFAPRAVASLWAAARRSRPVDKALPLAERASDGG